VTITKLIELKNPTRIKRRQWQTLQKIYAEVCNWVLSELQKGHDKLSSKDVPFVLKSALKNEAIRQAKKAFTDFREGRARKIPKFKSSMPVSINNQNWDFVRKNDHWYVGFTTNEGKLYLPVQEREADTWFYALGVRANRINPLGSAKLLRKNKKWFLAIPFEISCELAPAKGKPQPDVQVQIKTQTQTNIGIDLGLVHLAVVTEPVSNKRMIYSGKQVGFRRRKYRSLRRSLGKKKAQRAIKALGQKETRFMKDKNHKISRSIVEFAKQFPNPVIKLEDLSGIRWERKTTKEADRNLNSWAFYQLKEFISYKAKMAGIPVVEVSPKYTSQKCYACGTVRKSNRQGRSYQCACGYKSHADLNGARNIALTEPDELTHAKRSRKVAV
jgi:IS605 OrfB family transposase